jgi:carboxylesterase type B
MGLKWVYENIIHFGGNPESITIAGCSAGGQSVWLHAQEEASWPYFQKVISLSAPLGKIQKIP